MKISLLNYSKTTFPRFMVALTLMSSLVFTAGCSDDFSDPFAKQAVTQAILPAAMVKARIENQKVQSQQAGISSDTTILFGDTHVHTTYSFDAFTGSLPFMHGADGAYPPASACDYARFVSQLDFYFLTDHAESYTPKIWRDQVASIQECAALTQKTNPDLIPFIGFEWTQVGFSAQDHYGHHNVLFKDIESDKIPSRPIAAAGVSTQGLRGPKGRINKMIYLLDPTHANYYASLNNFNSEMQSTENCKKGIHSKQQTKECFDTAATPKELYKKLDQWGFDTLVIPHGTTWGSYTPPGASWSHQFENNNHNADKGRLIEIYSGHGTSEKYRNWQARIENADGTFTCPPPRSDYLPACWQAGEIIKKRCLDQGKAIEDCESRATLARQHHVNEGTVAAWWTVPGTVEDDWLDAAQARDVLMPAFNYRPKKSVQYGLALKHFDDTKEPLRNSWGFIGSTDTHSARAGHGFKQVHRKNDTDTKGIRSEWLKKIFSKDRGDAQSANSVAIDNTQVLLDKVGFAIMENERRSSFLTLGGLAAVHAKERSRDGIWDAMKRKEVYGTTGHRMLLWFNLINSNEVNKRGQRNMPMGSLVEQTHNPKFSVTAVGSFKQIDGCPDAVFNLMDKKRADKLSNGECYYPSDKRYHIERIEITRIRPQQFKDENVDPLIEDKWKVYTCPKNSSTCVFEFEDTDFKKGERDALYYARIFEQPIATINGGNLRTSFDKKGNPVSVNPCHGDYRVPLEDECTVMAPQRAWSSPIFVNYK